MKVVLFVVLVPLPPSCCGCWAFKSTTTNTQIIFNPNCCFIKGLFVCLSVCDKVNFTLRFKGQCVDSNHNLLKIKCDAKVL